MSTRFSGFLLYLTDGSPFSGLLVAEKFREIG
jgi:hypothetical protein